MEVDKTHRINALQYLFFNSRPLVEVDGRINKKNARENFSTHDLSWRSTLRANTSLYTEQLFNSRPLVEVDKDGRTPVYQLNFSTHDLSWRSTKDAFRLAAIQTFQLTTSRGGRRSTQGRSQGYVFFNSRPLVEVDLQTAVKNAIKAIFNSRPLVEVDKRICSFHLSNTFFNSRPLVEVDDLTITYHLYS